MFYLVVQARPKTLERRHIDEKNAAWPQFLPNLPGTRRVLRNVFEHIGRKDKGSCVIGERIHRGKRLKPVTDQLLPLAFVGFDTDNRPALAPKPPGKGANPRAEIDKPFFRPRISKNEIGQESVVVVGAFERCEDIPAGVFAFHADLFSEKTLYLMIA